MAAKWYRVIRRQFFKPARFVVPSIFLLLIGIGNLWVGIEKKDQYDQVLRELASLRPVAEIINTSPISRIQLSEYTEERLYQRQEKARARIDLYRLVIFNGKVFLALSLLSFLIGGGFSYLQNEKRHLGAPNQLNR